MTYLIIRQTADSGWQIVIPNAFEEGWETVLMTTDQNASGIRRAIALAAVEIATARARDIEVHARDGGHRNSMMEHVAKAAKILGYKADETGVAG